MNLVLKTTYAIAAETRSCVPETGEAAAWSVGSRLFSGTSTSDVVESGHGYRSPHWDERFDLLGEGDEA